MLCAHLRNTTAACLIATLSVAAAPLFAQDAQPETSPLVGQINKGNWLDEAEAQSLLAEVFYQRAVYAYMTMLPALNVIGMRDGSEAAFGAGYNLLPIWKDRMDSRAWVPTPNADVIYSMNYLDLKETGPLVVKAPPNVIGMFTDFFQRTITDVGAIGPDRARGGLYLLLPPGYQGEVPKGYFAFESSTYNVFLFFRTVMAQGDGKPDPAPAVANAETTRIYPLWEEEKDIPPMEFPNASGKRLNMMYPVDFQVLDQAEGLRRLRAGRGDHPRTARGPRLHRHREGRTLRAQRLAARGAREGPGPGAEDDPRLGAARPR